jgi:hypothetical protein
MTMSDYPRTLSWPQTDEMLAVVAYGLRPPPRAFCNDACELSGFGSGLEEM